MKTRQGGVAIVTALLLTTLAISIVASLFWQQQVQVRTMENQRLHLQTKWILRGALDWATLVLRQDGMDHNQYTALDAVWATPLAETRLDQYIERERVEGENFNATLSGTITDATSRYNLTNLGSKDRTDQNDAVNVFRKLLQNLQLNPALATRTANLVKASQPPVPKLDQDTEQGKDDKVDGGKVDGGQDGITSPDPTGQAKTPPASKTMKLLKVEDLLAVEGFTPEMIEKLRPFVIVLPVPTPVNVNTAPAEVLAAVLPNTSVSQANALLVRRKQAAWRDFEHFKTEVKGAEDLPKSTADVKSEWFLVDSHIRLDRAALDSVSLVNRPLSGLNVTMNGTSVQWTHEY
ncbi:type II secretion system minor pseudopilin GspK [Massilia horti]|nr:type II secretion system minor pseudopilin GspK [Massilia horti]